MAIHGRPAVATTEGVAVLHRDLWRCPQLYYWWDERRQFWLFTLYDKDETTDLTPSQRRQLKAMVKAELKVRSES